ncbi:hypothetical protein [Nocardioides sp.]|uniref:helix-turn-helix domain-containing protein n=1 Tax=Nocardioides sp. TaxID=35761 RepID=UPI0027224CD6|nr:hypothetical protein [Nocardioides sp.]MDO9457246.1 hypothetical protein [Nocardioides sp.]
MTTPFGPQLVGETEKTLGAVLRRHLLVVRLSEPEWVTLRLADQVDATSADHLATTVADRAHFEQAPALVAGLTARGLLAGGRLTAEGRRLADEVQAAIGTDTRSIWEGLDEADVAAATRVLNEVVARARRV